MSEKAKAHRQAFATFQSYLTFQIKTIALCLDYRVKMPKFSLTNDLSVLWKFKLQMFSFNNDLEPDRLVSRARHLCVDRIIIMLIKLIMHH